MRRHIVGASFVALALAGFVVWMTTWPARPAKFHELEPGLERLAYTSPDRVHVLVYKIDPELFAFDVLASSQPKRVKMWVGADVVMNGFYFLDDATPAGLLMVDGVRLGQQQFDDDKSGILELNPKVAIIDTATQMLPSDAVTAGQSYPFLSKAGQPAVAADSGLTGRRSFFGVDQAGFAYLGIVWQDEVSLYQLSQLLPKLGIAWENVLNLDGGPSTGLSVQTRKRSEVFDSAMPVANVITVTKK